MPQVQRLRHLVEVPLGRVIQLLLGIIGRRSNTECAGLAVAAHRSVRISSTCLPSSWATHLKDILHVDLISSVGAAGALEEALGNREVGDTRGAVEVDRRDLRGPGRPVAGAPCT